MVAMTTRTFDARPSADPRNEDFPIRPLLGPVGATRQRRKLWRRGAVLDQGQEGACVGHGVVGEGIALPVPVHWGRGSVSHAWTAMYTDAAQPEIPRDAQAAAFALYRAAQRVDEWPGEEYDGTSVNAGLKVARSLGLVAGWRWAQSLEDFSDALMTLGPVVIAIPWFESMYEAPGGEVSVSGDQVGWHCLVANGIDPGLRRDSVLTDPLVDGRRPMTRLLNSWGPGWGTNGQAWIPTTTLWGLVEQGDAAIIVGRSDFA